MFPVRYSGVAEGHWMVSTVLELKGKKMQWNVCNVNVCLSDTLGPPASSYLYVDGKQFVRTWEGRIVPDGETGQNLYCVHQLWMWSKWSYMEPYGSRIEALKRCHIWSFSVNLLLPRCSTVDDWSAQNSDGKSGLVGFAFISKPWLTCMCTTFEGFPTLCKTPSSSLPQSYTVLNLGRFGSEPSITRSWL